MKLEMILVDDDEVYIMMSEKMIEISKFHPAPISFLNGRSASEYLRENFQENVAYIIFLDINMPIMDGWEFLEAIKEFANPANTCIFMVTSSTDEADIAKAKLNPFVVEYLAKPILVEKLLQLKESPKLKPFFNPADNTEIPR